MNDPILDEAERQREHELKLAEIARRRADESRPWRFGLVWGLLGFLTASVLTLGLTYNAQHARAQHERDMQHQEDVAKACIAAGNIWINNACLLTRRTS